MKTFNANSAGQITLKAVLIGAMILVMLIPVAMLQSMIRERMEYQKEVETEIGSTWGGPQTVTGPVLVLPYAVISGEGDKKTTQKGTAYFLPEKLDIQGDIHTEVRSRTAHKVLLYKSELAFDGLFTQPPIESLGLKPENILWNESYLYIGISHLQGVQNRLSVTYDGVNYADAMPVKNNELTGSGLAIRIPIHPLPETITGERQIPFRFNLDLHGTGSLFFIPVGKETTSRLQSEWETVSFTGNYLPGNRSFENGFAADWKVFDFNRSYPQAWLNDKYGISSEYNPKEYSYTDESPLTQSAFGVDLRFPLDHYQLAMRSVKYAVMFIALTFFVFFLVELLSQRRIHPVQYLLVSCGLVLFYSLLLALSEHIGFDWAYLVSAVAIIVLITSYSGSIFKNRRQTLRMGLFLTALYAYLYVMLQLEDMALLFGSVGLFLALAIIMYVSRKVNWYKNGNEPPTQEKQLKTPTE